MLTAIFKIYSILIFSASSSLLDDFDLNNERLLKSDF